METVEFTFDGSITLSVWNRLVEVARIQDPDEQSDFNLVAHLLGLRYATVYQWYRRCETDYPMFAHSSIRKVIAALALYPTAKTIIDKATKPEWWAEQTPEVVQLVLNAIHRSGPIRRKKEAEAEVQRRAEAIAKIQAIAKEAGLKIKMDPAA